MVVCAREPTTWRWSSRVNVDIFILVNKNLKPDMVVHTCHPSYWGGEARGFLSFMTLKSLSLGCIRHFLKKKI